MFEGSAARWPTCAAAISWWPSTATADTSNHERGDLRAQARGGRERRHHVAARQLARRRGRRGVHYDARVLELRGEDRGDRAFRHGGLHQAQADHAERGRPREERGRRPRVARRTSFVLDIRDNPAVSSRSRWISPACS
ncbi:MAG: hypothetical protein ACLTMP_02905 [Eggerthella lenta]